MSITYKTEKLQCDRIYRRDKQRSTHRRDKPISRSRRNQSRRYSMPMKPRFRGDN
ncbi:MAG: hypothetical protein U9Q29_02875 [Campylobacterota bacterium]|nr:hypothetical protein [Campylobacterota bacterium]